MPPQVKPALDELQTLRDRNAELFVVRMDALADALIDGGMDRIMEERGCMARLLGETTALADLLGRKRLLLELAAATGSVELHALVSEYLASPVVPWLSFREAVREIVERSTSVVKSALEKTWEWVVNLHLSRHGPYLAKITEAHVAARLAKKTRSLVQKGLPPAEAAKELRRGVPEMTQAYAETVYRTNVVNAHTAGRIRQAMDPDIGAVLPAWELCGIADSDERPNHAAARGLMAATTDPIWRTFTPPLGYNCRHALRAMSLSECRRAGLMDKQGIIHRREPPNFRQARPDPGFGSRPDLAIYPR